MNPLAKRMIKLLSVAFIAFLFIAASPLSVSAAPAFASLSMDRTTVTQGQTVTFTIRSTPQTNFVFAMVDGVRTQGTRITGNDWTLTITPSRTTTVSIFANTVNNESGAAAMNIPITVAGTTNQQNQSNLPQHNVQIPAPPANLGPIAIASVTETPATAANHVQLTIVTGAEANEVWVNFNRVNNTRGTGNFRRATMLSQDTIARTWVVDIPLSSWTAQTVEIGSNRTYNWPGAATQLYTLLLTQPFVPPVVPSILNVTPSTRSVQTGHPVTFTIATNRDAEHVWVRDIDGREATAHRTTSTGTTQNWSVTLHPTRTGLVTIFANVTRTDTGAATRTEQITVGVSSAQIIGTPVATFVGNIGNNLNETFVQVVTNQYAERVWAQMPGTGIRVELQRVSPITPTGNRTWTGLAQDTISSGNIVIGVSSQIGHVNVLSPEDTRTIVRGVGGGVTGWIHSATHWSVSDQEARRNEDIDFRIRTSANVTELRLAGGNAWLQFATPTNANVGNNEIEWLVRVRVGANAPNNNAMLTLSINAYVQNTRVSTHALPATIIRP